MEGSLWMALLDEDQEVGNGSEAIQAMSSLQAEVNAILKSLESIMYKNLKKN